MSQLMCPIFGDLILDAVAVGGWFFILALMASAWWERRQARLLREQAKGQSFAIRRTTPLRAVFKRFRGKLLLLGIGLVAVVMLMRIREKSAATGQNPDDTSGLSAYATNFAGDMHFSVSAVKHPVNDLWNVPVLKAKTLDFNSDTNLFEKQGSNQAGATDYLSPKPPSRGLADSLKTTANSNARVSPSRNKPDTMGGGPKTAIR